MGSANGYLVGGLVGAIPGGDWERWPTDVSANGGEVRFAAAQGSLPTLGNFVPVVGTALSASTPIMFDVTQDVSTYGVLLIIADYPQLKIRELVHDGVSFGPRYQGASNSRVVTVTGFSFSILREGGWPESPSLLSYFLIP